MLPYSSTPGSLLNCKLRIMTFIRHFLFVEFEHVEMRILQEANMVARIYYKPIDMSTF